MEDGATDRPHVVIVGAGFGGIEAAKKLGKALVRVTVIDRTNHHLFQPLLYQVATAGLSLWFIQSTRKLQRMQMQVVYINRQRPSLQALAAETVEYSKRNPAIDPILQSIGFKPRSQGISPQSGKPITR